jgi:hypothetical protein
MEEAKTRTFNVIKIGKFKDCAAKVSVLMAD